MTSNTSKTNAWLYALRIQHNALTAANQTVLKEEHGFETVHMEGLRIANGSKRHVDFLVFASQVLDQEAEIFVLQNERFIQFAEETGLNDQSRFDAFSETIDGHVRDLFNVIRDHGSTWYDPGHADAHTDDGFLRILQALFVLWSKHDNPGDSLATRIMSLEWKNHTICGTFYRPSEFKLRLQGLWRIHDMLPRIGLPTSDEEKLRATWNGLTDEARDFIKDEKAVDPFDAAHFGANPVVWTDLYDLLEAFWNREFKKKFENFVEDKKTKRKRDDDDDNDDDNTHNGDDNDDDDNYDSDDDDDADSYDNRRNNRNGKQQRTNGGGRVNYFNSPCTLHDDGSHNYKDCIFCPTGHNFKAADAKQFYKSGRAPWWYKKTYETRILKHNGGGSPAQQQQQQYFLQPLHPQGASYMAVAPASASQVPAVYANQPATNQFAPTYATGTTSMAPAQNEPTYKLQTDVNGNQYFVQI